MAKVWSGITGEQIRAGRALVRIEQAELARRSGVSLETVKRLERVHGGVGAHSRTLDAILGAFAELGVMFDNCEEGEGVCRMDARATSGGGGAPPDAAAGLRTAARAALHQVVFHSRAAAGVDLQALIRDLAGAASRQVAAGVTGVVFVYDGRIVQALEGPRSVVFERLGEVAASLKHEDLLVVRSRPMVRRSFLDLRVCCGLFETDEAAFVSQPNLRRGLRPEEVSTAGLFDLLTAVYGLAAQPPRTAGAGASPCPLAGECLDQRCAIRASAVPA